MSGTKLDLFISSFSSRLWVPSLWLEQYFFVDLTEIKLANFKKKVSVCSDLADQDQEPRFSSSCTMSVRWKKKLFFYFQKMDHTLLYLRYLCNSEICEVNNFAVCTLQCQRFLITTRTEKTLLRLWGILEHARTLCQVFSSFTLHSLVLLKICGRIS